MSQFTGVAHKRQWPQTPVNPPKTAIYAIRAGSYRRSRVTTATPQHTLAAAVHNLRRDHIFL